MDARRPTRVGIIGRGAIGTVVARALEERRVPGCLLEAVLVRPDAGATRSERTVTDVDALSARCDVVVEAASHDALATFGPAVVAAGCDLLVVSTGALAAAELHRRVTAGSGRVLISTGAIGGLDALRAAQLAAPLDRVRLHTTKPAHALREPWMQRELIDRLEHGRDPVTVFAGPAREAAARFPRSINIAATLALATVGFDATRVEVTGDPRAERVEHVIDAAGPAGDYEFRFRNQPSPGNPRTSAITAYALLRALCDRSAHVVVGA